MFAREEMNTMRVCVDSLGLPWIGRERWSWSDPREQGLNWWGEHIFFWTRFTRWKSKSSPSQQRGHNCTSDLCVVRGTMTPSSMAGGQFVHHAGWVASFVVWIAFSWWFNIYVDLVRYLKVLSWVRKLEKGNGRGVMKGVRDSVIIVCFLALNV